MKGEIEDLDGVPWVVIDVRASSTTTYQASMIQDPAAEDSSDHESMERPELGHSDNDGEVNSGKVEVNPLVQQEKGNHVYKKANSRGHFQVGTQTMRHVQHQQNIT
ncbi:hypothetical protein KY285_032871 [Solanum tuberosum]|nr:hypothetical protein KY285_032871 [Solanum tuberosum]